MVMETRQRGAGTFGLAPVLYNTIHDHALGIAGCSSFTAYSVVLCIDHTYEVTYGAVLGVQLQRVTLLWSGTWMALAAAAIGHRLSGSRSRGTEGLLEDMMDQS